MSKVYRIPGSEATPTPRLLTEHGRLVISHLDYLFDSVPEMGNPGDIGKGSEFDWEMHWGRYGPTVANNPASVYRRDFIVSLLPADSHEFHLLDIGSGQGETTLWLARLFPSADVRGIEYSQAGVESSQNSAEKLRISATFQQKDLLQYQPINDEDREWADVAICTEVLEHTDSPVLLLRNSVPYLAQGCLLIVTVPGGPRTAFDRYIGHRPHFTESRLRHVLIEAGLEVQAIYRAGFPFFNLYKIIIMLRGRSLMTDVQEEGDNDMSKGAQIVLNFFHKAFKWNRRSHRLGWQLVAVARVPNRP